uniref:Capsid protein n=1 Tax=Tobacco necrosis virus (strain D) TaxID=12056 RepID=A0A1Z2THT4_TNVD|nr:29 kDa coat protein [Tobacco necrosis virus D]
MPKRGRVGLAESFQSKSKKQKEAEYNAFQRERMERALVNNAATVRKGSGMSFRPLTVPVAGSVIYSRPRVPQVRTNQMSTFVVNTELVANITLAAAGAFSFTTQPLIPSFGSWLANIADLYSKWRWISCSVVYIPKCPTSTQGSVVMAIVYDSQDTTPTTRTQVSQCYQSITFPPYAGYGGASALNHKGSSGESLVSTLDTNRVDKKWYSTIGNAAFTALTSLDKNQFCPATAIIAGDGGPVAATAVGDIFMRYEIEFIEPVNPTMNI